MALLAMAGFASWQWHNVPSPDDVESSAPVMGNEVVRLHLPEQEPQKLDYATNESGYISSTSPATPLASTSELLTPPLSGPVSSRLDSGAATEDEAATSPRSREGESEPLSRTVAVVERGDSLYKIFKEWNLPLQLLPALVESGEAGKQLKRLQPGQEIEFARTADGDLQELVIELATQRVRFARHGDAFVAEEAPATLDLAGAIAAATSAVVPPGVTPNDQQFSNLLAPVTVEVTAGDSLYLIFKRLGYSASDLAAILADDTMRNELTRINPGQVFHFHADQQGNLNSIDYEIEPERSLRVVRSSSAFRSSYIQIPLERKVATAAGVISSSLFSAGQAEGLSDKLIMQLAEVFGWDIDLALDIRSGDRFTVIYEEGFKNGEKVKDGPILAAEFVNRGRTVRALRFAREDGVVGYFTPDGHSMRRAFLRTPLEFSRVSSGFDLNRLHPVLHTIRAHRGVDYAAPTGTPIKATGDGKVAFVGRKGGYGNTILLRHGGTYTTLYAHLHRFASGIRTGASVSQGQVIGFVGKTGLATGPHLHYEFRVNGAHKDPVTVELPKTLPLQPELRTAFLERTKPLLAKLDLLSRTHFASNQR